MVLERSTLGEEEYKSHTIEEKCGANAILTSSLRKYYPGPSIFTPRRYTLGERKIHAYSFDVPGDLFTMRGATAPRELSITATTDRYR